MADDPTSLTVAIACDELFTGIKAAVKKQPNSEEEQAVILAVVELARVGFLALLSIAQSLESLALDSARKADD